MQRNIKFCVCVSVTWLFVFDIKDKQECEKRGELGNQGKSRLIKKIKFNQAVIGERGLGGLRGFARIFLLLSQCFFYYELYELYEFMLFWFFHRLHGFAQIDCYRNCLERGLHGFFFIAVAMVFCFTTNYTNCTSSCYFGFSTDYSDCHRLIAIAIDWNADCADCRD